MTQHSSEQDLNVMTAKYTYNPRKREPLCVHSVSLFQGEFFVYVGTRYRRTGMHNRQPKYWKERNV
jgi:hypothetical protein